MIDIYDGDLKLATFIAPADIAPGLNFYSDEGDFIQVSTWLYKKGKRLADHIHNVVKRKSNRTQEIIYIIKGAVKAFVYSEGGVLIEEQYLWKGDLMIFWAGGHGYKILENGTRILEVKNGPFLGVEKDKRLI